MRTLVIVGGALVLIIAAAVYYGFRWHAWESERQALEVDRIDHQEQLTDAALVLQLLQKSGSSSHTEPVEEEEAQILLEIERIKKRAAALEEALSFIEQRLAKHLEKGWFP